MTGVNWDDIINTAREPESSGVNWDEITTVAGGGKNNPKPREPDTIDPSDMTAPEDSIFKEPEGTWLSRTPLQHLKEPLPFRALRRAFGSPGEEDPLVQSDDWEAPTGHDEALVESFNPVAVFGGLYGAGFKTGIAAGRGILGAVRSGATVGSVGTVTDFPIGAIGSILEDSYGWGKSLIFELTAGLATGMTIDNFITKKLDSLGKQIGKSRNISKLGRKSPEEQSKLLDEYDQIMRAVDGRGDVIQTVAGDVAEESLVNVYRVNDLPQYTSVRDLQRRVELNKAREAGTREAMERAQLMQRQRREAMGLTDLPEPARTAARQAREASEQSGQRSQELFQTRQKEAAENINRADIAREAGESKVGTTPRRIEPDAGIQEQKSLSLTRQKEADTQVATQRAQTMGRETPGERVVPDEAKAIMKQAQEANLRHQEKMKMIRQAEEQINEEAAIADINALRRMNGQDTYTEADQVRVGKNISGKRVGADKITKVVPKPVVDVQIKKQVKEIKKLTDTPVAPVKDPVKGADVPAPIKTKIVSDKPKTADIITRPDGKVFSKRGTAETLMNRKGLSKTHAVMPEGDGFVIKKKPEFRTDAAMQVDVAERERYVQTIARARNVSPGPREEFAADFAHTLDELQPKFDFEIPEAPTIPRAAVRQREAQESIEAFLGEGLDGFEGGVYKAGQERSKGFPDTVSYREDSFVDDLDLEAGEGLRDLGDFAKDLYTVFGRKMGLSIDDVSKHATADQIKAAERLTKDFQNHAQKAIKANMKLEEYFLNLGWNPEAAERLTKQAEVVLAKNADKIAKDNMYKAFTGWKNSPVHMKDLSVEYPFRKIGAPETGYMFKVQNSIRDMFETEADVTIKKMTSAFGDTPREHAAAALLHENPKLKLGEFFPDLAENSSQVAKIQKMTGQSGKYFDKHFADLNKEGILDNPWPQSLIKRMRENITKFETEIAANPSGAKRAKLREKIIQEEKLIEKFEGLKYTPVLKEWFRRETNDERVKQIIRLISQKERGKVTLEDLYRGGLITDEQLDIRNLIGSAGRNKGIDIGRQRLFNAMKKEGLATQVVFRDRDGNILKDLRKKHPHLTTPNSRSIPMMKDYAMHPKVTEYTEKYFDVIGSHNSWGTVMNTVKMAQFFNPVIMPMYDIYQSVFKVHQLQSWRLPIHIARGMAAYWTKNDLYYQAAENGLFSKPFANPLSSWQEVIANAKMPMKDRMMSMLNPMPHKALKNLYNLSWDLAWSGDQMIRMASYQELIRRGYSPRDAGQLGALFHGDYASVPPQTRQFLNNIFFTPTFKIAMTKSYMELAKGAMKSTQDVASLKMPSKHSRFLAGGAAGLIAANIGKDMLMTHYGFEGDQWGRRYVKRVDSNEGPKDIAVTFSDPTNLPLRFMHIVGSSFDPGYAKTPIGRMIDGLKYELHPFYRIIALDYAQNRKPDGSRIYSPNDHGGIKAAKTAKYFMQHFIPITQVMGMGTESDDDREILEKQFGSFGKKLVNLVAFTYVKEPHEKAMMSRVRTIQRDLMQDGKEMILTPEQLERAIRRLDKVIDRD